MLLSNAKSLHINGKNVKEAWMGGKKVWAASAGGEVELPYTQLDWIQTSEAVGGYVINFTPKYNTHMEMQVAQTFSTNSDSSVTNNVMLFDAGTGYRGGYSVKGNYNKTSFGYALGGTTFPDVSIEYTGRLVPYNTKSAIVIKDQIATVRNNAGSKSTGTYQPTKQLMVGNTDSTSSIYSRKGWKIFDWKIYDENDALAIHLIPVLKKADNKPYLYDLINDVYYSHSGTSAPTYGRLA